MHYLEKFCRFRCLKISNVCLAETEEDYVLQREVSTIESALMNASYELRVILLLAISSTMEFGDLINGQYVACMTPYPPCTYTLNNVDVGDCGNTSEQ